MSTKRVLVGYGDCKCILTQYCDGQCRPLFDFPSPAQLAELGRGLTIAIERNLQARVPGSTANLDARARRLYESMNNRSVPSWDQLGDTTKMVWRDRVAISTESTL